MAAYRLMGKESVRKEFTDEHCKRLVKWFNSKGEFVEKGTQPSSRERLWNCFSLLSQGGEKYRKLAYTIIKETPIDHNHFEPIAAANLLLTYKGKLPKAVEKHLLEICQRQVINIMEFRFGTHFVHNFSCMTSLFLLACSELLDYYTFDHEFASIKEVYTKQRLYSIGMNSLYALAYRAQQDDVIHEYNSPTYTPISLHALAKIVELIPREEAKRVARELEMRIWREVLVLYHPKLGLSCGPYSRAYRIDILGMTSQMRILLAFAGISKDKSIVSLLDENRKGIVFHHDNDVPFVWSGPAWQISEKFHVPQDALDELKSRTFPKEFKADIHWESHGYIDTKKQKYISVQGDVVPDGKGQIRQIQTENWALGYRSMTVHGHGFPIFLHYKLRKSVKEMEDVRTCIAAVMLRDKPVEWVSDHKGGKVECSNFNHNGELQVKRTRSGALSFQGQFLERFCVLKTDELSVNSFVPIHFRNIDRITLNGKEYSGKPIIMETEKAVCTIEDADMIYEIQYRFRKKVKVKLFQWANFMRFAGFPYSGKKTLVSPKELKDFSFKGTFKILTP